MGFLAEKSDGSEIRVSSYGLQYVDSSGNVWDESTAHGGRLVDTGIDVSSSLYDDTGDPVTGGGGGGSVIAEVQLDSAAGIISLSDLDLSDWAQVRVLTHLRAVLASEGAGNWMRAMLRFNGDDGANYIWGVQNTDGANVSNESVGYIDSIEAGHMAGPNKAANLWGTNIYDFFNPGASGFYKNVNIYGGIPYGASCIGTFGTGFWLSTDPITEISVLGNDLGDIQAGSRLIAIGIA